MPSAVIFLKEPGVSRPQGGFLLWVEMPEQVDALRLYEAARMCGISIAPGHLFSLEGKFSNCIRLNAACWDACVEAAIVTLGSLATEQISLAR